MKTRYDIRFTTPGTAVLTAAVLVAVTAGSPAAQAQVSGFYEADNPYVTVDLSALEGQGAPGSARSFPMGVVGVLNIPGPAAPESQLYVKPEGMASGPSSPESKLTLIPPSGGMGVPPVTPPQSTIDVPGQALPEPAAPKPEPKVAAAAPAPKPAPKPQPEPAPAPAETAEAAPPPPTVEAPAAPAEPAPPRVEAPAAPTMDAPPPPPEGMAAAPAEAPQQASLPPADISAEPGLALQVVFEAGASKLPDTPREELKALVGKISETPNLRLQLLAYAGGESLSSSKARRLSLSRALSVRSFLIENGLRSTRIDVRALGNKTTDAPTNRVDINIVER